MKKHSDNSLINLRDPLKSAQRKPLLIAHRGGVISSISPENSLNAIRFAGERFYDLVELDIAESRDNVPVLFHGWNGHLGIDCGINAFVYELDSDELLNRKYLESNQCIASLSQALEICREYKLGVMLDIKEFGPRLSREFFLDIASLLETYKLVDACLTFSQNPMAYEYLRNVMFALSNEEIELFKNGEIGVARGRWLFALPGELAAEFVEKLQENDCMVIVAINLFRYPAHAHEISARKDIMHLSTMGIDGFQIDSRYEAILEASVSKHL